jgi:hypothetical protein
MRPTAQSQPLRPPTPRRKAPAQIDLRPGVEFADCQAGEALGDGSTLKRLFAFALMIVGRRLQASPWVKPQSSCLPDNLSTLYRCTGTLAARERSEMPSLFTARCRRRASVWKIKSRPPSPPRAAYDRNGRGFRLRKYEWRISGMSGARPAHMNGVAPTVLDRGGRDRGAERYVDATEALAGEPAPPMFLVRARFVKACRWKARLISCEAEPWQYPQPPDVAVL